MNGSSATGTATRGQLELYLGGLQAVALDAEQPLRRPPSTLAELDRHLDAGP